MIELTLISGVGLYVGIGLVVGFIFVVLNHLKINPEPLDFDTPGGLWFFCIILWWLVLGVVFACFVINTPEWIAKKIEASQESVQKIRLYGFEMKEAGKDGKAPNDIDRIHQLMNTLENTNSAQVAATIVKRITPGIKSYANADYNESRNILRQLKKDIAKEIDVLLKF